MFEVLIVDDEPYLRDALRCLVDWEQAGFRIAGEAINGREALEILRGHPADVVFTDIRMPVMNGLELIEAARRERIRSLFVILSAYDEFHLVKDAFKLGAIDYVLKSELEEGDILSLLARCREGLSARPAAAATQAGRSPRARRESGAAAPAVPPLLGLDWLRDSSLAGGGAGGLRDGPLCAVVVRAGDSAQAVGAFELVRPVIESRGHGFFLTGKPGDWAVLCSFSAGTSWLDMESQIGELFDEAQQRLREAAQSPVSAGASGPAGTSCDVPALLDAAYAALQYGFVAGNHRLVFHNRIPDSSDAPCFDAEGRLAALREALRRRDLGVFRDRPEIFTVAEARFSAAQVPRIRNLFERYFYYLRDFVHQNGLECRPAIATRLAEYQDCLRLFGDLRRCNEWLRGLLRLLGEELCGKSRLVQRAMTLVSARLEQGVGLADAAREAGVSESYFSRVFSRQAGMPFVAYLTRCKMERAAEYLACTDLKIYEIADRLGYANPEHFSRVFKKTMGKSPREFQRAGGSVPRGQQDSGDR